MTAHDRVGALSQQLTRVHQALREQLSLLRSEITEGHSPDAGNHPIAGGPLGHCLSLCTAIRAHHAGEDNQLLPALRAAAPELAPVIDKLTEDHALVAGILLRIGELLNPGLDHSSPGALTRELDGLMAILESHFSYEERRLARALDALGPSAWTADVFTTGRAAGELA